MKIYQFQAKKTSSTPQFMNFLYSYSCTACCSKQEKFY